MKEIHLDPSLCLPLTQQTGFGRTFLLPPEENVERIKVTRKVVEIIDHENGHRVENINFILDVEYGRLKN